MNTNVKNVIIIFLLMLNLLLLAYLEVTRNNSSLTKVYNFAVYKNLIHMSRLDGLAFNIENKEKITPKNHESMLTDIQTEKIEEKRYTKYSAVSPSSPSDNLNGSIALKTEDKVQKTTGEQLSRGATLGNEMEITLTFYTSLPEENGGFDGINCTGQKLSPGMVANNILPLGTKIYTEEFGLLTVSDRGGNNFNTIHRLDVFISRNNGESNREYKRRVNDMGVVKIKGYMSKM